MLTINRRLNNCKKKKKKKYTMLIFKQAVFPVFNYLEQQCSETYNGHHEDVRKNSS